MIQRIYLIDCPNEDCPDYIALPRQSPLGKFDNLLCRPKGTWPIKYLCQYCGRWSDLPVEAIHHQGVEVQVQSLEKDILWRYDFSASHEGVARRYWLYTKAAKPWSKEQFVEFLLVPLGLAFSLLEA